MTRFIPCAALLALIAGGCNDNNQNSSAAYHQSNVQAKPVVSIVPIIDNTNHNCTWNLSDELSSAIFVRSAQNEHVTVNKNSQVRGKAKQIGKGQSQSEA